MDLQNKKITLLIIDPQIDFHPPTAYYEVGGESEREVQRKDGRAKVVEGEWVI